MDEPKMDQQLKQRIVTTSILIRLEEIYDSVECIRMGLIALCLGGMVFCIKRILDGE